MDCLKGKALKYVVKLKLRKFSDIKHKLARRFEMEDAPAVSRMKEIN
jgi:hypothetical protein